MSVGPKNEEILASFEDHSIAEQMAGFFDLKSSDDSTIVEDRIRKLHESGSIDVFTLVEDQRIQSLPKGQFFTAVHVFCNKLPAIRNTERGQRSNQQRHG